MRTLNAQSTYHFKVSDGNGVLDVAGNDAFCGAVMIGVGNEMLEIGGLCKQTSVGVEVRKKFIKVREWKQLVVPEIVSRIWIGGIGYK